ncbi:MAG: L-glutamate gamma-semialdehyde dehydrogenase, partial [Rubrivivax sp.]|nr:L-glutamate gamma-semialdehyde dehydrogenase [Rubrivivax sp.]
MTTPTTPYRLTYATMFDPPPSLHQRFDEALVQVRRRLGADHAMCIGAQPRTGSRWFELRSPIDRDW